MGQHLSSSRRSGAALLGLLRWFLNSLPSTVNYARDCAFQVFLSNFIFITQNCFLNAYWTSNFNSNNYLKFNMWKQALDSRPLLLKPPSPTIFPGVKKDNCKPPVAWTQSTALTFGLLDSPNIHQSINQVTSIFTKYPETLCINLFNYDSVSVIFLSKNMTYKVAMSVWWL